jgi:hypothetical protein
VEPPGVEQRGLPVVGLRIEVGDASTSRPETWSDLGREENAVNGTSATSALEIQAPVAWS